MAVKISNVYIEETPHATLEIGNTDSFKAKMKFRKWPGLAGAADFSMELDVEGESGIEEYEDVLKKVKWKGVEKKEAEFYPLADGSGYEHNVILLKKPDTNVLNFSVTANNAVFYRQGPLTELIGQHGIVTATDTVGYDGLGSPVVLRPENVVGSYAVYHTAPPVNIKGETEYKAGKLCHIYRPKAFDKDGVWVWCDLSINGPAMTITIPQAFIDSAKYPVTVDPTFGYTTIGGSSVYFDAPGSLGHVGAGLIYAASNAKITKFSIYGSGTSYDAAAYTQSGGLPVNRLAAAVTINFTGSPIWNDSAALSQIMMNGSVYGMAVGNANNITVYFDTGAGNQRSSNATNLPAVWSSTGVTAALYSWYATYESFFGTQAIISD